MINKISNLLFQKKYKILALIIIFPTLLIIILTAAFRSYIILKPQITNNIIYQYKTFKDIDYKVFLKKNDFIKNDYLEMNNNYITELIDSLDIILSYNLNGDNNKGTIQCSYNITADIIGDIKEIAGDNNNDNIWRKTFILRPTKEALVKENKTNIIEHLNIDLNEYSYLVNNFKQILGIPINAFLTINMNIFIKGTVEKNTFHKEETITLNIPLDVKVFSIQKIIENKTENNVSKNNDEKVKINYISLSKNLFIILASLFIITIIIKKILYNKKYSNFQIFLNKIRKEYEPRIIDVVNIENLSNYEYVDVTDINDLIELSDEQGGAILFYRKNKKEIWFCIIKDKIIYRYILENKLKK